MKKKKKPRGFFSIFLIPSADSFFSRRGKEEDEDGVANFAADAAGDDDIWK